MAWNPKEKEVEALLSADAKRRYEYFIQRVCDTRKVWGLYDEGWASLGDDTKKLIPFWPHETYAKKFKEGEWSSYEPKEIDLSTFLEKWLPGMKNESVDPAVFPVGTGNAVLVSLEDLEANLRHQLTESYGDED